MNRGIFPFKRRDGRRRVTKLSGGSANLMYAVYSGSPYANALTVLTPPLTAGVWVDAVVINGPGQVNWLAVESYGATGGGTVGRLILDGEIVSTTTALLHTTYNSTMLVGGYSYDVANSQAAIAFQPVQFSSQLRVQVKVGNASAQMNIGINYEEHSR